MKEGIFEAIIGFIVLLLAVIFFVFAYQVSGKADVSSGYNVTASFENIEGINNGSEVKISGIKIGQVQNIILEEDSYQAIVTLNIDNAYKIPKDSSAIVSTSGLLGGRYIRINPGAEEAFLDPGDKIRLTQSALNIEDLIAKLMYSLTSNSGSN